MPLENYFIRCYTPGCTREAIFKIASHWSDGVTSELKTYSLCCETCLADQFRVSLEKQAKCRTAPGETLEPPHVYRLRHGQRDRQLERQIDLEQKLLAARR